MNRDVRPSRILSRIQQREHQIHRERLTKARPHFKINQPVKPLHLQFNWKRQQLEREHKVKMLRDNEQLVQKMLHIESNPGRLDPSSIKHRHSSGSLNAHVRINEFEEREKGNRVSHPPPSPVLTAR